MTPADMQECRASGSRPRRR